MPAARGDPLGDHILHVIRLAVAVCVARAAAVTLLAARVVEPPIGEIHGVAVALVGDEIDAALVDTVAIGVLQRLDLAVLRHRHVEDPVLPELDEAGLLQVARRQRHLVAGADDEPLGHVLPRLPARCGWAGGLILVREKTKQEGDREVHGWGWYARGAGFREASNCSMSRRACRAEEAKAIA